MPDTKRHPTALILSLVALLLVVPLLAFRVIQLEGPRYRQKAQADLAAICQLKANQIESWLAERYGDAAMLTASEGFVDDAERWFDHHDPAAKANIAKRLTVLRQDYDYQTALLDIRAADEQRAPGRQALMAEALATGRPRLSELYRGDDGQVGVDLLVPLIKPSRDRPRKLGVAILRIRASGFLFPMIQSWPTASPSAETLLFRRDGDSVLFLNVLRHRAGAPMTLRLRLDAPDLPAAIAARGGALAQTIEGRDYRGIPVLAAARPISGTPWFLLAKVDRDEVMRPLYKLVAWVSTVAMVAIVIIAMTLLLLWRQQQRSHLLELKAQAWERDRLLSLFYDLPFMGMAIIDPENGHWLHVNDPLCEMLGYRREELLATTWEQHVHPEDIGACLAQHRRMLAGEIDGYQLENRFLRKDGGLVDIALAVRCVRRADGRVEYMVKTLRDISERKWGDDLVRRSQQQLYSFVEQAPLSIAMFDRDMNYLAYSRRWLVEYGRGYTDLLGQNHYDLHPDIGEAWKAVHRRGMAGETIRNDEDHWRRADGSEQWLRWAVVPWRDGTGKVGGIILSAEDITEKMSASKELADSRARLAGIIDSAMDAIVTVDAEQRIRIFNPAAERMFGYPAAEMMGQRIDQIIPARLREAHRRHMQRFALEGVSSRNMTSLGELSGLRRDGSEFPIEASISKVDVAGEQVLTAILRDVSERKRAETALREREEDLKRAQAVGRIGSWRLDVRRNELTWSEENHRIFGVPEGTPLTYEYFLSRVHPDDRAYVDREWQAGLRGAPYDIEHRLRVDGQVKWVREKAELEFEADGTLLGGFGITQDITDIKVAEQALRDSEERFQLAAEIGRSGTWDWDLGSGKVIWSRGHYEILGYRVGEIAPSYQAWVERVHPEDRERIETEIQQSMRARRDYAAEFRVLWPDGSLHWMSAHGRHEFDSNGVCLRMVGVMADVTSLKQAELALREADQRKDEFLAMLAHELRNPLAPIRNAAHVLGHLDLDEPRVRWAQDIIERQVAYLTHLVDELLDVSRIARGKVSLKKTRIALADLVRQSCEAVQPLMSAKAHRLEVRMPEAPVWLEGDLMRLIQVLQNLLGNAAKYTPDGGHIELLGRLREGEMEIEVRDNGMGMQADLLPGVFDLFRQGERTLDRAQGGLGIGLTLVRRLVELHGGRVEAHSPGPGQGSTFTVRLPILSYAPPEPAPAAEAGHGAGGAKMRVLVVEDDPVVAESMVVFLELEGHKVRSADSGDSALRLLQEFQPQVVLLDIGLPGQDGYEVARRIRQVPGGGAVKLVAVSGYGHPEALERGRQAGFDHHLVKPVDPTKLAAFLAEIGAR